MQWREANRRRQRQTIRYRGLVPAPPPRYPTERWLPAHRLRPSTYSVQLHSVSGQLLSTVFGVEYRCTMAVQSTGGEPWCRAAAYSAGVGERCASEKAHARAPAASAIALLLQCPWAIDLGRGAFEEGGTRSGGVWDCHGVRMLMRKAVGARQRALEWGPPPPPMPLSRLVMCAGLGLGVLLRSSAPSACDSNPSDSKHIFPASCDGIEQYQKCDGKCQAGYDGEPWAYCGAEGRWTKFGSCKPGTSVPPHSVHR